MEKRKAESIIFCIAMTYLGLSTLLFLFYFRIAKINQDSVMFMSLFFMGIAILFLLSGGDHGKQISKSK